MPTVHIPSVYRGRTSVNDAQVRVEVQTLAAVEHTLLLTPESARTLGTMLLNASLTVERARLELPNPRPGLVGESA